MKQFTKKLSIIALATMTLACTATADTAPQNAPLHAPKYAADVPANVLTPNSVNTKYAGELNFVDGFPTDSTLVKTNDFMDTARAFELFESGMATASMYAMLNGHAEIGIKPNRSVAITEQLMDAKSLWLTPNTTTPYAHIEIDVKNGPVVVEVASPVISIVDDAYFKYVGDIGMGNPKDAGKGGKYLIVGDDYKGDIPEGYIVMKTSTYRHWMLVRPYQLPGEKLEQTLAKFKKGFKIYPLADAKNPAPVEYINVSGMQYNTLHATDATIYNELNEVIQYEPANSADPEMLGLARAIGIEKGKEFKPDARMQKILTEASSLANAAFRGVMYKPRNKNAYFYPDRQWFSPLAAGSHEFLDANGARSLDDRIGFHFYATGITPFMVTPMIGKGSVYEVGTMDEDGAMLDGSKTYTVTLPGPVPARNFWSFMVYDNHTRSILETDQKTGGVDSKLEGMIKNEDGGVTIFFGPKAPVGQENNWVQTMPGKGFNVLLRIYGPEQEWFDKTWKPSDFIPVK
ncbi:DUF1254 domain-containing protein [Colwelliaceae bacterium BS250]